MRPGMIWQVAAGSFGVTAAVLLVLGWVALRYHRDRRQFQLMQAALEKGVTNIPGAVPGWLISLRQGVLSLVLGIGVVVAGAALHASASRIDPIPANVGFHPPSRPAQNAGNPPPEEMDQHPFPPGEEPAGPRPPGGPEPRDPQDPVMERWHRVQTQTLIGLLAICAGGNSGDARNCPHRIRPDREKVCHGYHRRRQGRLGHLITVVRTSSLHC